MPWANSHGSQSQSFLRTDFRNLPKDTFWSLDYFYLSKATILENIPHLTPHRATIPWCSPTGNKMIFPFPFPSFHQWTSKKWIQKQAKLNFILYCLLSCPLNASLDSPRTLTSPNNEKLQLCPEANSNFLLNLRAFHQCTTRLSPRWTKILFLKTLLLFLFKLFFLSSYFLCPLQQLRNSLLPNRWLIQRQPASK